jgi:hypothetical protein
MSTNQFLPTRYDEVVHRLAIGVEPIDPGRRARVAQPIAVTIERPLPLPECDPKPKIDRHPSALYAIRYQPKLKSPVLLRFDDPSRRFVSRRLRIRFRAPVDADAHPPDDRVYQIVLHPGAAYETPATATGVRGRVTRAGVPLRWCRVVARLANGAVVGRASGDDRGEFLLLVEPEALVGEPRRTSDVAVTVFGPKTPAAADRLPDDDRLRDLAVDDIVDVGGQDPLLGDEAVPSGGASLTRTINLTLGQLQGTPTAVFEFA